MQNNIFPVDVTETWEFDRGMVKKLTIQTGILPNISVTIPKWINLKIIKINCLNRTSYLGYKAGYKFSNKLLIISMKNNHISIAPHMWMIAVVLSVVSILGVSVAYLNQMIGIVLEVGF